MTRSGFTLLELSVTIIAIALLVGGVLSYDSLRKNAETQKVLDDYAKYHRAVDLFQEKYNALPGDMPNATALWDIANGTGNDQLCYETNSRTLVNPRRTCNGNGDGFIEAPQPSAMGGYGNLWHVAERWRAWQHLANAGLIEGNYAGSNNGVDNAPYSTLNVPATGMDGVFAFMAHLSYTTTSDPHHFPNVAPGNQITFSLDQSKLVSFFPRVFQRLDAKIDDGLPAQGKVTSYKSTSAFQPGCTTTNAADALYDVDSTRRSCVLLFFRLEN